MIEYRIGDVFDRLAEIPDGSVDLLVTSPPFLALRSYLPADHPDKHREIGSEPTPAAFLDTLLALSAEWGRVLAPHGSLCVELGDTYSGVGGSSSSANPAYGEKRSLERKAGDIVNYSGWRTAEQLKSWPLAKSLTGIPTLYTWSLAYARNLLTGEPSPAGQWRIRNLIVWARPNPPVGALGDKFRPATSYITVACRGPKRYFDLDAVRVPGPSMERDGEKRGSGYAAKSGADGVSGFSRDCPTITNHPAGAPPLDWHADDHPEDGDWLWKLSTQPYKGSHYATFPLTLPKRLIEAMCPLRVCRECGRPSERVVEIERTTTDRPDTKQRGGQHRTGGSRGTAADVTTTSTTIGWTDCGHDAWRVGVTLDPFGGSGTTAEAAQAVGRHAILIDLDQRNGELARERCGMFLEVSA